MIPSPKNELSVGARLAGQPLATLQAMAASTGKKPNTLVREILIEALNAASAPRQAELASCPPLEASKEFKYGYIAFSAPRILVLSALALLVLLFTLYSSGYSMGRDRASIEITHGTSLPEESNADSQQPEWASSENKTAADNQHRLDKLLENEPSR